MIVESEKHKSYNICIGNHMISSAIWNKTKTNKIWGL